MLEIPRGPKNSSRLVEASQCFVSFTSWPARMTSDFEPAGYSISRRLPYKSPK